MKILITGGAGFLGSNISQYALAKGHKVVVFDNMIRPGVEGNITFFEKDPNYQVVRGDVRNPEDFNRIPNDINAIIHLAANPGVPWSVDNPRYDFEVNARGTFNVLEFARTLENVPVIYASTNKVYSDIINKIDLAEGKTRYSYKYKKGIDETFPVDSAGGYGHSPYGCSKYTGDIYCQEYYKTFGVPTVVNRMSCIYGEFQHGVEDQGWVAWFIIAKILGRPLNVYGDGKQVRDVLFGSDIARLYIEQLENINEHKGRVYNVGGGPENSTSLLEFIELLNTKYTQYPELKYESFDWRPSDHRVYISDITKISSDWQPEVSFEEGVERSFKWLEKNIHLIK